LNKKDSKEEDTPQKWVSSSLQSKFYKRRGGRFGLVLSFVWFGVLDAEVLEVVEVPLVVVPPGLVCGCCCG
jgi:hypothetical protein